MPVLKQNDIFAGRYVLDELIGAGGFSEVWKAHDQMAYNAVVAIKIYAPGEGMDDDCLRQCRNEFALTYSLSHPHLLKVHHYDVANGSPYLIMTYCPFGSLAQQLGREGICNEKQVALMMYQIGAALTQLHSQLPAIVHQDIKPENILLPQPDCFVLADFGISSRIRNTIDFSGNKPHALTIAYAPPERFHNHFQATPASDIFSLGVTLYEMCTNTVPWEGAGGQCLLQGAVVPQIPAHYSPHLREILKSCMAADPAQRPTAAALSLKGKLYLETGMWYIPLKKNTVQSARSSRPAVLAAAIVALLTLLAFGFYTVQQSKETNKPVEQIVGNAAAAAEDALLAAEEKIKTKALPVLQNKKEAIKQLVKKGAQQEPTEVQPAVEK